MGLQRTMWMVAAVVTLAAAGLWLYTGADFYTKYTVVERVEKEVDPDDPLAGTGFYDDDKTTETVTRDEFSLRPVADAVGPGRQACPVGGVGRGAILGAVLRRMVMEPAAQRLAGAAANAKGPSRVGGPFCCFRYALRSGRDVVNLLFALLFLMCFLQLLDGLSHPLDVLSVADAGAGVFGEHLQGLQVVDGVGRCVRTRAYV